MVKAPGGRGVVQLFIAAAACGLLAPTSAFADRTVVSLTFDDGWDDQMLARPILAAHGMKATFFIISGKVDQPGRLTLTQIRALAGDGHEIGGHTVSHPDLTSLSVGQARSEI